MEGSRSLVGGGGGGGGAGEDDSSGSNGLRFGKKIYFEDLGNTQTPSSSSSSISPMKEQQQQQPPGLGLGSSSSGRRGRGLAQSGEMQQPPRCQVEGCGQDLTAAKAYYRRHKVCGTHSKSPRVTVAGIEQRFCQQCSRFQQLPEFDQGKRSCRRRLAGHNERRRKPPSGSFSSRYGQLSPSSFHVSSEDGGRFGGYLMDFSRSRLPGHGRDMWAATGSGGRSMTGDQWVRTSQVVPPYITQGGSTTEGGSGLFSGHQIPPGECLRASDSNCALSLLSTQQWGTTTTAAAGAASSNYGGSVSMMGQASNPNSFLETPWSSNRHHHGSSSNNRPGLSMSMPMTHNVGFGDPMEPGRGQFSGEPEHCMEREHHGRRYDPSSGSHMHWPPPPH